ncbi:MAG: hypothetical protein ABIC40_06670 [bacterium]
MINNSDSEKVKNKIGSETSGNSAVKLIFEVIEKLHAEGSTIIYTSHYMEEVERLCQNIAILDHGKVVAVGTKAELIEVIRGVDTIEIELDPEIDSGLQDKILSHFGDMSPTIDAGLLVLRTEDGSNKLGEIVNFLTGIGVPVKRIHVREPNLENVFLYLTGKGLRD